MVDIVPGLGRQCLAQVLQSDLDKTPGVKSATAKLAYDFFDENRRGKRAPRQRLGARSAGGAPDLG
jgi:hypothetical protein